MAEVSLCVMTRELCHELYRNWEQDPDIYMDMELFVPYVYSADKTDRYFDKKRQALQSACDVLGMDAVNADTVMKNTRSQHVLEKIGFQHIKDEGGFRYYQCQSRVGIR